MSTQANAIHKLLLRASVAAFILSLLLFGVGNTALAGPLLVAAFLMAGIGVRGSEKLGGISFSLLIFAGVTFALCYPGPLVSLGDFRLSTLIVPLLQIIMFGMGVSLSMSDFI